MTTLIVLRLLHIVTGILWGGALVFMTFYLMPAVRDAGPAGGAVMAGLMKRRLMTVLPLVALVTIASGLALVWLASGGNLAGYVQSPSGKLFTSSGGLAILAFAIGVTVSRPAGMEVGRLAARLPQVSDPAERELLAGRMALLQRRNLQASRAVSALVLLAAMGMAVARYAT